MGNLAKALLACVISVLISGCMLQRSAVGRLASWDVQPELFCPGDPVTISWDFRGMPKSPDNCRPRNGGLAELRACTRTSQCTSLDATAQCLDGFCCRSAIVSSNVLMCEGASGCFPVFDISVTADTFAPPPVDHENRRVLGSRLATPPDSTTFTITGNVSNPLTLFEETKRVTMVRPMPPTGHTLNFPFECVGATPGWKPMDFNAHPLATEHVRITGVRNVSGHTVILSGTDPARPFRPLARGEVTRDFDGPVRGVWRIALDPLDPASFRRPSCLPTRVADPWPDLAVELILTCVAP